MSASVSRGRGQRRLAPGYEIIVRIIPRAGTPSWPRIIFYAGSTLLGCAAPWPGCLGADPPVARPDLQFGLQSVLTGRWWGSPYWSTHLPLHTTATTEESDYCLAVDARPRAEPALREPLLRLVDLLDDGCSSSRRRPRRSSRCSGSLNFTVAAAVRTISGSESLPLRCRLAAPMPDSRSIYSTNSGTVVACGKHGRRPGLFHGRAARRRHRADGALRRDRGGGCLHRRDGLRFGCLGCGRAGERLRDLRLRRRGRDGRSGGTVRGVLCSYSLVSAPVVGMPRPRIVR